MARLGRFAGGFRYRRVAMFGLRISWRALTGWVVASAAVVVLAVVGLSGSKGATGRAAPALPNDRLIGPPATLASLRGAPALVVFWASWCTPCEQEAPALERFWRGLRAHPGTRGTLVGVDWSDPSVGNARAFVHRYGWTFPTLRDPDNLSGQHYGVRVLPTTFAIDAQGRIRATLRGPQSVGSLAHALALANA
ncbi:MAG TPA: TlpA disulfide reductase family protein [Solirubrobacteraceae bacterium]|nr:TlpA disulfide reductase family protein [Solirubrobacteraceae bacterium]